MKLVKKIALGVGAALLVYLTLSALAALLIVRGTVSEERVGTLVWIFAGLAAFAGARLASYRTQEPLVPVAVTAAVLWAAIQLLGFLANDTLASARSAALALPILLGAALAWLLKPRSRKGKKSRARSRRSHK